MLNLLDPPHSTPPVWYRELAQAYSHPAHLLADLGLEAAGTEHTGSPKFPFRVTRSYAARMRKRDPDDPLLRQVLPRAEESKITPGYLSDPVGDIEAISAPGVLHKYHARVLLITTGACAIHCRYCFRREFPYAAGRLTSHGQHAALQYIAANPGISEVILSGGDPFVLEDRRLENLVDEIAAISHVRRLRIHTRVPIVLPSRITPGLINSLTRTRLPVPVVVHANHANELNTEVSDAIAELRAANIVVLNQSVLLRGINDSADALSALCERLFEIGILPYYLHLLDKVTGTAHFEILQEEAVNLHRMLRRRLPGYLVPRLAREQAGAPYKVLL